MMHTAAFALMMLTTLVGRAVGFTGVQTNLPIASLSGWTLCYSDTYGTTSPSLSTILTNCNKANLLLACRPTGSMTLSVAAHAPRADVTFDTGTSNTPHNANGVGWYFNNNWSWGFAPAGDPISRNSCDVIASSIGPAGPDAAERLCWHTGGGLNPGWRCGAADSLFGNTYERLIFQTDTLSCGNGVLDPGEQCDDGNGTPGDGCDAGCQVEPCYTCSGQPSTCSPLPDGSACDDGLFCNGTDTCSGATCTVHTGSPCLGGTDCTNVCNEISHTCVASAPAGTPCTDDGNVCTFDQCNGTGTCVHPNNNFVPCDDGVFCNGADVCLGGTCTLHNGDPCVFNECNTTCDEMAGVCDPTLAGTPCSDDGNICTNDQCDGMGSCAHPPVPSGVACPDDGLVCTADQCDGLGDCAHPPLPGGAACPDEGNACTIDECDGIGLCVHPARPDGTACNDSNACTQTDRCQSGQCVGSDPVVCAAPLCHQAGTCDPSSGTCSSCPTGYSQGDGGCQKTYPIDVPLLDNLNTFCDGTGANRYNGCSVTPFGFHWADTGDASVGPVVRVDVALTSGIDCGDVDHAVALNETPIGIYASTAAGSCNCVPPPEPQLLSDVDTSSYVKGGANAVSIDTTNCAGLSQDADGDYATVTVTYQDPGLPLALRTGCRQAAKSHFRYKNNATDALDKMNWKWGKGDATTRAEFGDPTTSADYRLCVFGETSNSPSLLIGADVPASANLWSAVGKTSYKYGDVAASADGMKTMLLRGGASGKAKLLVNGQGASLGDPSLPLPLNTTGIRVQLSNQSSGLCWESEFPLSRITADDQSIRATVR